MTTPSSGGGGFQHPESNRGGADAVNDTPGVAGRGAHPGTSQGDAPTTAPVASRGGFGVVGWVVVAVLILLAMIYGLGFIGR